MDRVPGTKKTELEKIEAEIEEVTEQWRQVGLHGNMTQHSPESVWMLKVQVQALMNIVLKKELCTQDEINTEFKRLILNDMRILLDEGKRQKGEALTEAIVPKIPLLGPDGQPFKI